MAHGEHKEHEGTKHSNSNSKGDFYGNKQDANECNRKHQDKLIAQGRYDELED